MTLKELNYSVYKSAEHLAESGKYMMALNRERGLKMMEDALLLLSVIKVEEEKVPKERLESIMNEIMSFKAGV